MGSILTESYGYSINISKGVCNLSLDILDITKDGIVYSVEGTPICCYDQHSRARIGADFYDYKVSYEPDYTVYSNVFNRLEKDYEFYLKTMDVLNKLEQKRITSFFETEYNLMSRDCSYKVKQTWKSLFGQMMRRLKFCEEEFIVGLHWLIRDRLINNTEFANIELGPFVYEQVSKYLPGCDHIEKCDYSSADYLSNMFGCLFASCGRWKGETDFATFNESCTTPEMIEEQLGIIIPRSKHERS